MLERNSCEQLGFSSALIKRPSTELFSVQVFDGCAAFLIIAHAEGQLQ
jgi:hypothetical protein